MSVSDTEYNLLIFCILTGASSSPNCKIEFPFSSQYVTAYNQKTILGTGCTTNQTRPNKQEVHVINLLNLGPVYRNDIAEVNLLVKSRSGQGKV